MPMNIGRFLRDDKYQTANGNIEPLRTMKGSVLNLLRITGAFAPFRWAHRHQALIVTYHRFSEREGGARISARAFAEQVKYLAAHYTLVPLSQFGGLFAKARDSAGSGGDHD